MESWIALWRGRVMQQVIVRPTTLLSAALTYTTIRKASVILPPMLLLTAPAVAQTTPLAAHVQPTLEAHVVEQERSRTCSKLYEWPERFHCFYEFTVLARRVRELPNYSGVEMKEDVQRDIELTFETLKRQFAIRS